MPTFRSPEYDYAFGLFFHRTTQSLAIAQHAILGEIRIEEREGGVSSVVDSRSSERLDLESDPIAIEIAWDRTDVLAGDFDATLLGMDKTANELGGEMVRQLVKTLSAVTDSTGNKVDAGGKGFSFELVVEALEKLSYSLDENDELVMPSILMHPDQAKGLLTEATPEQEQILEDLKRRKKEELLAERRVRRLS